MLSSLPLAFPFESPETGQQPSPPPCTAQGPAHAPPLTLLAHTSSSPSSQLWAEPQGFPHLLRASLQASSYRVS